MTTQPLTDEQLPARIAGAIRAAAYDCDGNCGLGERECDARHPIHVAVLHFGEIADVYGTVDAITATVLAVVQPELDRLREVEAVHRELTGSVHPPVSCSHGHTTVHVGTLAQKISEKRTAMAQRAEACREVDRLRAGLTAALQVLDAGPRWVNDRVEQHWSVPAARAAEILRDALNPTA